MGQKHQKFWEFRTPFPRTTCIRKNPRSMYARVPHGMAQLVLKLEKLSHIIDSPNTRRAEKGRLRISALILEMAHAYGLRPRLWLLLLCKFSTASILWLFWPSRNFVWNILLFTCSDSKTSVTVVSWASGVGVMFHGLGPCARLGSELIEL